MYGEEDAMRGALFSLFAAALGGLAFSVVPAGPQTANHAPELSPGWSAPRITLVAELAKPIDAKRAKVGEPVELRLTMDLLARGEIIVPRRTKIIGHIVSARAPTPQAGNATVEIAFDRLVLKKAAEIPLKAEIQALAAPMRTASPDAEAASDLDLATETTSHPAPGPNEMKSIAQTTYPGTRGPANAATAGKESSGSGGGSGNHGQSLGPASHGVIGIKGIDFSNTPSGFTITSDSGKLHLESGTQLVLRILEPQSLIDSLKRAKH
jgi:hypothetical protein